MTARRAPIPNVLPAVLALLLAGCGSGEDSRSAAPADGNDRAARAYEHAKALEENAARLEADLARLSGEPSPDASPEPAPPAAAPPPSRRAVVATAEPVSPLRPGAARAPIAPIARATKAPVQPSPAKPETPQPTAGELQRAIAPGGLLSDDQMSPKLDYNGMP